MSIAVQKLSFSYGAHRVLSDVTFTASEGALLAVLGPNGVGKSTMFRCMLGLMNDYTGTVAVNGTAIRTLSARQMARRIAYIPQSYYPTFHYSVLDMVLMGTAHQLSPFALPGSEQTDIARQALAQVGVEHLAARSFHRLSGGEQQLTMIARALAQQAGILVMDEPTSNLDFGNQLRVLSCIQRLAADGYTVLLSSHNPQHALTYADRILALIDGKGAADGSPRDVLTEALLMQLYGVQTSIVDTADGRVIVPRTGGGQG